MKKLNTIVISILLLVLGIFSVKWLFFSKYTLYLQTRTFDFRNNSSVLVSGKKGGKVVSTAYLNDSTILLQLELNGSVRIPARSKQRYFEDLFGAGYLEFLPVLDGSQNARKGDTIISPTILINNSDTTFRKFEQGLDQLNKKFDSIYRESKKIGDSSNVPG